VFLFSGYVTNLVKEDVKTLEILQPDFAIRLNGNITYYKNYLDKISINNLDEEVLLDSLRQSHRLLKFQIIFALINHEINIDRASQEFSLLAQATFDTSLKIAESRIIKKYKIHNLSYSIVAYGRFATLSMTANSDLDLVFIYNSKNSNNNSEQKIYIELFRQLIRTLSSKTTEGLMYEVDTKLRPSGKEGPVVCTYDNFKKYHQENSFCWEKLALKKTRIINENNFNAKTSKLLEKLKTINISDKEIAHEIAMMRTNVNQTDGHVVNKRSFKWFETKYVGGGQREIEYLNFFYKINSNFIEDYETNKKTLLNDKVENLFFKLDQVVNICFEDEKQDYLPSAAIILIITETNEKDLGSLKASVNLSKKEIHKNLNQMLESIKNNPNLAF
jgi:glutamine synthetase adenylyltransferase